MKHSTCIIYTVLVIFVGLPSIGWCQQHEAAQDTLPIKVVLDTIRVDKNSYVFTPDSAFFAERDTVIYVTDTIRTKVEEVLKQAEGEDEQDFYKKLKAALEKRKLGGQIFDWIFEISDNSQANNDSTKAAQNEPSPQTVDYIGKYVGDIYLKQIDVFGPSVTDTARQAKSKLSQLYNRLHIHTSNRVLYNNLLLEKGDVLTPTRLADNERVIRSLRFIQDARLVVQPRSDDSDTVDLLLITEDVIPYTAGGSADGFIEGDLEVTNRNVLGTGHELSNRIIVEPDEVPKVGYEGRYHIPNIRGSFIEGEFWYRHTEREDIRSVIFNRRFVVPAIRYAGGLEVSYNRLTTYAPWVNSFQIIDTFTVAENVPFIRYGLFNQDYWLGRSLGGQSLDNRTRFILAARYNRQYFYERPEVSRNENPAFHHRQLVLGSFGFSKRYYTTEQLVYTYGRTEDIPIGQLAQIMVGPEYGEFYDRVFTGISYTRGGYMRPLGYISARVNWGGFWRNKAMEDGEFRVQLNSFSYMIHRRRTQYRFFIKADYTRGINRVQTVNFQYRYINLRDENGIRGLSSVVLEGNERVALSLEMVAYPPINLYSFRFAGFAFIDAGLIAQPDEEVLQNHAYRGYGLGFRVRNENLAFKTFQVRFTFYPRTPEDKSWFGFRIGSIPVPNFMDFEVHKPEPFQFR
uniref:Bacterial surface antigen (D15) domain-containing protein n=1 Tax=Roseihalotalea indica TaxID=2867963 RepID=A0AA49PZ84_9BACT|nr:hypothetical protein K4G66_15420 [Tunicatimonas sp. TK19036]